MINLCTLSVISTAEAALKKLKKAEIPAYNCKKQGAEFIFSIKDKDIKKVFAIFSKPCYNVKVIKKSRAGKIFSFIKNRAGLVAGAALFVALAVTANSYVLRIEVSGSGSYLEPEVRRIVLDEGAGEFRPFSALNKSVATGRILSLPQVTFCNIQKRGSVLVVDVRVDEEHYDTADLQPLYSDRNGIIKNIVAVCGTAVVSAGDEVKRGDALICPYTVAGEKTVDCMAAGYAELECKGSWDYFSRTESEESLKDAYASLLLEDDEIISRSHTVKPTDGGVIYELKFTYLHKLSINLS